MSTLAIGTVQFVLRYGVANAQGQVPADVVADILARAWTAGVDTLDTAAAYGESEACLGRVGVQRWRVITKLPPLPAEVAQVGGWVDAHVGASLQRLGIAHLDGLLLHRSSDLLGPRGGELLAALIEQRTCGRARSVGISIYDPAELEAVWQVWSPEMVQAPCNLIDQRLIRTGWLAKLSASGARVHLRSLFMQGLLLMPAASRPAWFARWAPLLDTWLGWCAAHGVQPVRGALAFARALPGVERLVIGVDSMSQLEEILAAARVPGPSPPENLCSDDRDLLEPSRWKLT